MSAGWGYRELSDSRPDHELLERFYKGVYVQEFPDPDEREIREWLEGNLCRCTGYQNIVRAVKAGARAMR